MALRVGPIPQKCNVNNHAIDPRLMVDLNDSAAQYFVQVIISQNMELGLLPLPAAVSLYKKVKPKITG